MVGQDVGLAVRIHLAGVGVAVYAVHHAVDVECAAPVELGQILKGVRPVAAAVGHRRGDGGGRVASTAAEQHALPGGSNARRCGALQGDGHAGGAEAILVVLIVPRLPHGESRQDQRVLEGDFVLVVAVRIIVELVAARLRLRIVAQALLHHAVVQQIVRAIVGREAGERAGPAIGSVQLDGVGGRALVQRRPAGLHRRRSGVLQGEAQAVRTGAVAIVKVALPILGHADLQRLERVRDGRYEASFLVRRGSMHAGVATVRVGLHHAIVDPLIVLVVLRQAAPVGVLGVFAGILVQRNRIAHVRPGDFIRGVLQLQRDAARSGDAAEAAVAAPGLGRLHAGHLHVVGHGHIDLIHVHATVQAGERAGLIVRGVGPICARVRFDHAIGQHAGGIDGIAGSLGLVDVQILPAAPPILFFDLAGL